MRRHLASQIGSLGSLGSLPPGLVLVALLALAPGCKSMGGVMSGLGHVAAGAARGVAHAAPAVARGVAHAGGAIAHGVVRSTPTVLRATEAVVETAAEVAWSTPTEIEIDLGPAGEVPPSAPPVSDDPCQTCPTDDCGACAGFAGYACVESPARALARCESSAPPDALPVSAPPDAPPASAPPPPPASAPPPPAVIPSPGAAPGWFRF